MSVDDRIQNAAASAYVQLLSHYVIKPTASQALGIRLTLQKEFKEKKTQTNVMHGELNIAKPFLTTYIYILALHFIYGCVEKML